MIMFEKYKPFYELDFEHSNELKGVGKSIWLYFIVVRMFGKNKIEISCANMDTLVGSKTTCFSIKKALEFINSCEKSIVELEKESEEKVG